MKIFVNEQKLDATLAGEKNLTEVYDAIEAWSGKNDRYIIDFRVDSRTVALSELSDLSPEKIDRMDFIIGDRGEMLLSSLEEIDAYIDKVGSYLFENPEKRLEESEKPSLREGLSSIAEVLESARTILNLDLNRSGQGEDSVVALQADLDQLLESNPPDFSEKFLAKLRDLKSFIMRLISQLRAMHATPEQLLGELAQFERELPEIKAGFAGVNEDLNRGQDRQALENLDLTGERLNEALAVLNGIEYHVQARGADLSGLTSGQRTFREQIDALSQLLNDLSSAFLQNDLVAVGDILEYELTENLDELAPYLTKIRQLFLASQEGD